MSKFNCKAADCAGKDDNRGMVLLSVLVLIGLLAGIVVHSQVVAGLTARHSERKLLRNRLRSAATDAAWSALRVLAEEDITFVSYTNSPLQESLPNGIETFALIMDEQRLFDVNNIAVISGADPARDVLDIIAELLEHCDIRNSRSRALELATRFHSTSGQQPGQYRVQSPAQLCRLLELGEHESGIALSVLTALPHERTRMIPVNVNTAGPEVLQAVIGGRDRSAAEAVCRVRDAHPIMSLTQVADLIGEDRMRACRMYLDVKSSFFSVHAVAEMNGYKARVFALARRDDRGDIEILRWVFV